MTGEFGQLASEQDTNVASKTSLPVEPRHWAGRALVLRSPQTGRLACAALQPPGAPVTTYAARFQGPPVAGTLFLRLWPTFASVYAELHWTNGTRRDAQVGDCAWRPPKQCGAFIECQSRNWKKKCAGLPFHERKNQLINTILCTPSRTAVLGDEQMVNPPSQ